MARRATTAAAAPLLAAGGAARCGGCAVALNRTLRGECPASRYACADTAGGLAVMVAKRGCCGIFTCGGRYPVQCCSPNHFTDHWCSCADPNGTAPVPPGRTFRVDAAAPAGGDGVRVPFRTVQRCVDAAAAMPNAPVLRCAVAAGRYPESVQVPPFDWVAAVQIVGAGRGVAELTGATALPDQWEQHQGGIWKMALPPGLRQGPVEQVLVGGEMAFEARWPDATIDTAHNLSSWQPVTHSSTGSLISAEAAATGIDWAGALVTKSQRAGSVQATVGNYTKGSAVLNVTSPHFAAQSGEMFWLSGVLGALDAPNEWHLDKGTWTLYLWPLDGKPPRTRVAVKTRPYCINAQRPVLVANMTLRACAFWVRGRSNVTDIDNLYPSYERAFYDGALNQNVVQGDDNVVERVRIQHTNVAGVRVFGARNRLRDVLIDNTGWVATWGHPAVDDIGFNYKVDSATGGLHFDTGSAIRPTVGKNFGPDNVVEYATIRRFSGFGVHTSQISHTVAYTHINDGTTVTDDTGCLHADNIGAQDVSLCENQNCSKSWHHIWVHDCQCKCVRGDDGSMNISLHHAVVFRCGAHSPGRLPFASGAGVMLKGDNHDLYAATIFNSTDQGELVMETNHGPPCGDSGCDLNNHNSRVFNVATRRITGKKTGFPPQNRTRVWAGVWAGGASALRLRDPLRWDFRPAGGSPLIGAGTTEPPLAAPAAGGQPDIGAYQHDDPAPWRPGCRFAADC